MKTEFHTLQHLVKSYLQHEFLVKGECIGNFVEGKDGGGGGGREGGTFPVPDFEWQVSLKSLKAGEVCSRGYRGEPCTKSAASFGKQKKRTLLESYWLPAQTTEMQ
jgi:hypothetical protein